MPVISAQPFSDAPSCDRPIAVEKLVADRLRLAYNKKETAARTFAEDMLLG